MRRACLDQIQAISETVFRDAYNISIYGPPGTGKSLTTYYLAATLSLEWTVIWLHVDFRNGVPSKRCQCVIMEKSARWVGEVLISQASEFLDYACNRFLGKHVVILDGITSHDQFHDLINAAGEWRSADPDSRRRINVSSMAFVQKPKDTQHAFEFTKTFRQTSWSLDEYRGAMSDKDFAVSVEKYLDADPQPNESPKDIVGSKYFYAGGCARAMFERSTERVKDQLILSIDSIDDFNRAIEHSYGLLSDRLTHSLVSVFRDRFAPRIELVSDFVSLTIAWRLGPRRIRSLSSEPLFARIPFMNGGLFEAYFFAHETEGKLTLRDKSGGVIEWSFKHQNSFFDPHCPDVKDCGLDRLLLPRKWNQAGYDAVFLLESDFGSAGQKNVVRFVQITTGSTHELKLSHFADLVRAFENNHVFRVEIVEIVFVVPISGLKSFKVTKVYSPHALATHGWPCREHAIRSKVTILGLDF